MKMDGTTTKHETQDLVNNPEDYDPNNKFKSKENQEDQRYLRLSDDIIRQEDYGTCLTDDPLTKNQKKEPDYDININKESVNKRPFTHDQQ
jgi:hypothetical protein